MLLPFYQNSGIEVGIDEAGRGPLAGPVMAAAVILDKDYSHPTLNDSKKISKKDHQALSNEIKESAIAWGIALSTVEEIDKYNILNATFLAMHRAVDVMLKKSNVIPTYLLIDGNRFKPFPSIPHRCIIKGDSKYFSIAAASILAKSERDRIMNDWHEKYPQYGWITNAGYPTKKHRQAIARWGSTPFHRKSFRLI